MAESKLVRDRIPDLIRATGGHPIVRVAQADEMRALLRAKLAEEVREYLDSDDPTELADVAEVLNALALSHGINLDDTRMAKFRSHGGFGHGYVLGAPRCSETFKCTGCRCILDAGHRGLCDVHCGGSRG